MAAPSTDPEQAAWWGRKRKRNRNRNLGSTLIFAALAIVLAAAAYVFYQDENDDPNGPAPVPTAAGRNELINVKRALEAQGLTVEFGRTAVRATGLTPPPQPMTVGDATVYAFIYDSVVAREAASENLDPATLAITTPLGTPVTVAGGEAPALHVTAGSNVIAVLAGGSTELAGQVDAAIASLP